MFIQDMYDDVTKNIRKPLKMIIGIPVTSLIVLVALCALPIVGILWVIDKIVKTKPIKSVWSSVRTMFRVLFKDVKKCPECHEWQHFDSFGNKTCKCKKRG